MAKYLSEELGYGRKAQRLFERFLYGYLQQACKVAGMKRPRASGTGKCETSNWTMGKLAREIR